MLKAIEQARNEMNGATNKCNRWKLWLSVAACGWLLGACQMNHPTQAARLKNSAPCAVALTPHRGAERVDAEIIRLQQAVQQAEQRAADTAPTLERLGWAFIEKARRSYDPGFYKLAEQCAACLQQQHERTQKTARSYEALLLRGHVLQNLHRFKEAEPLARELADRRGLHFDHALLGDVLMEQGRLDEAAAAYQKMMDLKPGLQAYSRAAHLRWLKGDLDGAREMIALAVQAASPRDAEAAAWVYTRAALYEWQASVMKTARASCDAALQTLPDYAPALLLQGRLLLAADKASEAVAPLQRAAQLNPLPEYQWTLADALREAGREAEARAIEAQLAAHGATDDPRTYALYLATRGTPGVLAVKLAEAERAARADVFTLDAQAWALARAGRTDEAQGLMRRALAAGTRDARLHFHAALIAAQTGDAHTARQQRKLAKALQHMLLPSERAQLSQLQ